MDLVSRDQIGCIVENISGKFSGLKDLNYLVFFCHSYNPERPEYTSDSNSRSVFPPRKALVPIFMPYADFNVDSMVAAFEDRLTQTSGKEEIAVADAFVAVSANRLTHGNLPFMDGKGPLTEEVKGKYAFAFRRTKESLTFLRTQNSFHVWLPWAHGIPPLWSQLRQEIHGRPSYSAQLSPHIDEGWINYANERNASYLRVTQCVKGAIEHESPSLRW